MEVVNRWRASKFERGAVEKVLADDVEWVVPKRGGVTTLRGIDAVLEWYNAGGATDEGAPEALGGAESVDFSEERGELEDFGDGRVGSLNRLIYTSKESGEIAYVKTPGSSTPSATGRSFATSSRTSTSPKSQAVPPTDGIGRASGRDAPNG